MEVSSKVLARKPFGASLVKRMIVWCSGIVAVILISVVSSQASSLWQDLITMTLIWGALATAWNVVGGFAGQISLGHAGFFGVGAYTSTLLYVNYGVSPWFGIVAAIVLAGLVSWLVGIVSFRFQGPYFSLATLAVGLILYYLSIQLRDLTLGEVGISIPYKPSFATMTFDGRWQYALLAGGFLLICLAISQIIASSRLGYQLAAIGDDEQAARALGVNASRSKLLAACLSGGMAGGVGTIYAQYILYISPESVFGLAVSIEALVLALVGGSGVVLGPLVGAVVLVPTSQLMLARFGGDAPGLHTMIYAVVLIVVVLLVRGGLYGFIQRGGNRVWTFFVGKVGQRGALPSDRDNV